MNDGWSDRQMGGRKEQVPFGLSLDHVVRSPGEGVQVEGRCGWMRECRIGGTVGDKGACRRITRTLNVTVRSLDLIQ